ncbi:MAG TPA: glycosyltransferase family 9 protein [Stellaceae bacterium]|nr:glycosyltransferase family 9 protein [Stellaceae bacterium]
MLLTNVPLEARAAPAMSVLEGMGLVDGLLTYPYGLRDWRRLARLRREICSFQPDLLVYLLWRGSLWQVVRDYLYFSSAGIARMVGFPFAAADRRSRPPAMRGGLWQSEAQRLASCIAPLGDAAPCDSANWDLRLTEAEQREAQRLINEALPSGAAARPILGLSIGTKQPAKDWGDDNWRAVLRRLADDGRPLLLIGSGGERARSQGVAEVWPGPVINVCGEASPRVSAALIARSEMFLCHDSGPMHLAAAVGTRCIAVFSTLNLPGQWFPFGTAHRIFYPHAPGATIRDIRPDEVADAASEALARRPPRGQEGGEVAA